MTRRTQMKCASDPNRARARPSSSRPWQVSPGITSAAIRNSQRYAGRRPSGFANKFVWVVLRRRRASSPVVGFELQKCRHGRRDTCGVAAITADCLCLATVATAFDGKGPERRLRLLRAKSSERDGVTAFRGGNARARANTHGSS
jgi:hypothetical protein